MKTLQIAAISFDGDATLWGFREVWRCLQGRVKHLKIAVRQETLA